MSVVEFPSQDKQTAGLQAIQGVAERTRTISVTERVVAKDADENPIEREKITKVLVRPLPFRRWADVFGYLTGILNKFPKGDFDLGDESQLAIFVASMVGNASGDIFAVASLATDMPVEFFDHIDLDDGIKIILAVVEVNKDFFVQKVLPMISEVAPSIKEALAGTFGQTQ